MHYACHLVDRYLAYVIREKLYDDTPNLYHLAAVSCLIAAKLEEPVSPSFNRLMAIIPSIERRRMSKKDLTELEKKILMAFDFDIKYVGPHSFLFRY